MAVIPDGRAENIEEVSIFPKQCTFLYVDHHNHFCENGVTIPIVAAMHYRTIGFSVKYFQSDCCGCFPDSKGKTT